MSLAWVLHILDFSSIILEGSVELESNVNFVFAVKDKYQTLTPPSEDGTQYIIREVDGDTRNRVYEIKVSDLIFYDTTKRYVVDMLSYLHLIPQRAFRNLTQTISNFVSEAAQAALEEGSKFFLTLDVEVVIRQECQEGIEVIGGDEESSFNVVPTSRSSIEALKIMKYEKGESVETCMICMEKFMIGVDVMRLPCSHIFHGECIVKWLDNRNTCPLCRFEMPTEP